MQTVIYIREHIDLVKRTGEVFISFFQAIFMRENLKTIDSMVKDYLNIKIEIIMKDNLSMDKKKEEVCIIIRMEINMMVIGLEIKRVDMVLTSIKIQVMSMMVIGSRT